MKESFTILSSENFWRNLLGAILAIIFVIAGLMKLSDSAAFTEDIMRYRIFSEYWSAYLAASLPPLEIVIGLALLAKPLRLSASFLILGLMMLFTGAVGLALMRGLDISCGCFGKAFKEYAGSGFSFFMRDTVLLALAAIQFWLVMRQEAYAPRQDS